MFKNSKKKIVAAIMSILVLLWVGTLGIIYTSSYFEMSKRNREMLQAHSQMYVLSQSFGETIPMSRPRAYGHREFNPRFDPNSPMFQLSTFYTVAFSYDGAVLEIMNKPPTVYTDEELKRLAQSIIKCNKTFGRQDNLAFYMADKDGYMLVTFMDNTVVNESAMTLFRYTLVFGGVAIILFFFLSVFLARKIVNPLEESYKKQKQFVSDSGHELKTPVSVISANAELLSREIGNNRWLQNIQYENERMGLLIGQLLDLARTENAVPQMEQIDFSRLVAGETLPFESVAFEKGLFLNTNITENISVNGDSTQLKQIVCILLDNAVCHSKEQSEIYLSLTKKQKTVILSVVNKGNEIPQKQREQIFERFYRIDTARSGGGRNYGLGLSIAKAITNSHKGNISVLCYDGLVEFQVKLSLA